MRLADFYQEIGPYLLGLREHDDVVQRLYGGHPPAESARLSIYRNFCRQRRQETLESVFTYSRDVIARHSGEAAWEDMVERYFVTHPMHHFELNQNGVHFPGFLAACVAAGEFPTFLGELASFEWMEWLTDTLPDHSDDTPQELGTLQLHPTVDLRPYSHDLIRWIDEDERRPAEPLPMNCIVLFFRDRDLWTRRRLATGLELMVIKAIVESVNLDDALASQIDVSKAEIDTTITNLQADGVLKGVSQ